MSTGSDVKVIWLCKKQFPFKVSVLWNDLCEVISHTCACKKWKFIFLPYRRKIHSKIFSVLTADSDHCWMSVPSRGQLKSQSLEQVCSNQRWFGPDKNTFEMAKIHLIHCSSHNERSMRSSLNQNGGSHHNNFFKQDDWLFPRLHTSYTEVLCGNKRHS